MDTNIMRKLKTLKGSVIQRSLKYGVGKSIGGYVYLHKDYEMVLPIQELSRAKEQICSFEYNCLKYGREGITFFNCEEFDNETCPVVGEYIKVYQDQIYHGYSKSIWHHKWLWVKDDYQGFNVECSFEYSRSWVMKAMDVRRIGNKEYWEDVECL
jgi:hypothetical protein